MKYFSQPILFLVFNRPDTTKIVFDQIKKIKPKKLYIAADGARNSEEKLKCEKVKEIVTKIDWECETYYLFSEKNKGCKLAVSSAIDWFFENEEMGIILEDDCLPTDDFFCFCSELLDRYKDNEKIMQICGYNALKTVKTMNSYIFSKYGPIWGWASWKRAWLHYDVKMEDWPIFRKNQLYKDFYDSKREEKWRLKLFDKVYLGKIDTWDFQWAFSKLKVEGVNIIPKVNLVQNIGIGKDATHTFNNFHINNLVYKLYFPLNHQKIIERDSSFDKKYFKYFASPGKIRKAVNLAKTIINKHT